MDYSSKKILIIDLKEKDFEFKSFTELFPYIGGVGMGLKLLTMYGEEDPIIFSVGPFNGFYPYASKTSIVLNTEGVVEDLYIGGPLSLRIRYMGVDAIVLKNACDEETILDINSETVAFKNKETNINILGLPGRRALLAQNDQKMMLDGFFTSAENFVEDKLKKKNVTGIAFTGTKTFEVKNPKQYEELFKTLLGKIHDIQVPKGQNPSCSGCPMGCDFSAVGEIGGNVLIHSLVACKFAEKIYSDVGIVFSCLSALGYQYRHEDIENQPHLVNEILKNI